MADLPSQEALLVLAERVGRLAQHRGLQITTAESCTGGGVAQLITAISGSSEWFESGYVTYSNAAKQRMLGVCAGTLERHGAVSAEVVREMVAGACRDSGAALGVAISGVAGPGGGSAEKPVGTVWLGWGDAAAQEAELHRLDGDRAAVRLQAVALALEGLAARLAVRG
ncbi:CinA family protein [Halotalea alkalilenta]|uniref:CinA family protein n=1 Tax=Halotalea alkalilenta TaxID=376489 RepID=UPI00048916AA|nr:nicotinamide-nucleotide amidohydrolase family protein [Halotalea alkalilenta]